MGRAHIADPEIVNKTYRGELDDIRPCLRCNVCGERPKDFLPVRCAVNPVIGREVEYRYLRRAERKKKVIIVGGGLAGMEAAIIASSRGHQVTLYEKKEALGGTLRIAASPSFKIDMRRYLKWIIKKTQKSSVEVKLLVEATADSIKEMKPDVVIVAVGAEPIIPEIPGIKKPIVVWAGDVDTGKTPIGKQVLVVGAGLTGCETGLQLAQQGRKVKIIDMIDEQEIAKDTSFVNRITLIELLHQNNVEFKTEVELKEITDRGAIVTDKKGNRFEITADNVILSLGLKSLKATVKSFQGLAREVYAIGDCSSPRNLMAVIHDAFTIAAEL
jgi:pyruvate/2-oxoglutarate dehydrogenase complex dihydrolipoamide dehydrogenase (E3) component